MVNLEKILSYVEEVIRIPDTVFVDLSKDGKFAVFLSNSSGSYQLWSLNLATLDVKQISHGDERVTFAEISPDCKTVVFSRDFGGAERHQFFSAPLTGEREEEQISKLRDIRVFDFAWSPSGKDVAFTGCTAEANQLWLFDMENRKYKSIYKSVGYIFSPDWTRDGKMLVASAKTTEKPRSAELLLIEVESLKTQVYTPRVGSENSQPKWNPDGNKVLFKTNAWEPTTSPSSTFPLEQQLSYIYPCMAWIFQTLTGHPMAEACGLLRQRMEGQNCTCIGSMKNQ
ncbi:MAG: hypothetical protein QW660_08220 [Candidatus Bathyarchaeia archaeon]